MITVTRKENGMAGRARAVPVTLTIKRHRKLRQVIAAGTSPQRLVLRARIVMAAAAGEPNARIARDLGCSIATVRTWRDRFARPGIPGIFDKPRSGRPEVHGPGARLAVVAVATPVPPDGESQWSHSMIARHLRERGLQVSPATTGRVLAEAEVRPHKVRGWLNRADDPSFWARAGAVCRLYLSPPPGTVLISIDEKTGIQARTRTCPDIPGRPGRDARREWLAAHPRFEVTRTPVHASWLSMIEQWSGVPTRRLLRRGNFASRDDLETRITEFTIHHNQDARPYKWSYDADHARYVERHPSTADLTQAA